ncbi:hypothetical protein BJ994_001839 [Arthrobacter pigmenti]|uniref:Uncharacterized protein n=1 Tax=Arthrobacter pigmenti TaxID=271432 RepID=A0A846RHY9_9MICC|nr:hypothetical protein [Arthrobacter pigmenti]NJC22763.1 hypothetical protein [Arthrobacter pigmenti]
MAQPVQIRIVGAGMMVAAAVALSGCNDFVIGDRPPSTAPSEPATSASAPVSTSATPQALPMLPERPAPGEGWVAFTDEQRLVSFELPEDWTVEPIEDPGDGFEEGGLHFEVLNADGDAKAELHTRITPRRDECEQDAASPYTVLASEPVDIPSTAEAEGSIEPRFVLRLIQGFRFFSSYGVTDMVGGAENSACVLLNTVQGPEHIGLYSFGDRIALAALDPSQVGSGTESFPTIADAQKRFDQADFDQIRRMITSLQVAS